MKKKYLKYLVDRLRDMSISAHEFQETTAKIASALTYEALDDLPIKETSIQLWTGERYPATMIKEESIAIVPILRAGLGMVPGVQYWLPNAPVYHLGMYRNEETLEPIWYYNKLPTNLEEKIVFLLDPMLATGGSILAAIEEIKKRNPKAIYVFSVIGAPEGKQTIEKHHPDVKIYLGSLDEKLNEKGYILPGLGDAGDRLYNTQ